MGLSKQVPALKDLCIDTICKHRITYFNIKSDNDPCELLVWHLNNPNIYLPAAIAEKLLQKFLEYNILSDENCTIFSGKNVCLQKLYFKEYDYVTERSISKIINDHPITHLSLVNMKAISFDQILDSINSLNYIKYLDIQSGSFFTANNWHKVNKNTLTSLNVSSTATTQEMFIEICKSLQSLQDLNISETYVTDLRPLCLLGDKLLNLSMRNLIYQSYDNFIDIFSNLNRLKFLDLSRDQDTQFDCNSCIIFQLLSNNTITVLPKLTALDISGYKRNITSTQISNFLAIHPHFQFLGVIITDEHLLYMSVWVNHLLDKITVAGLVNLRQMICSLRYYKNRSNYVKIILQEMITQGVEFNNESFEYVMDLMKIHKHCDHVQIAACEIFIMILMSSTVRNIYPEQGYNMTTLLYDAFTEFEDNNDLQYLCIKAIELAIHHFYFDADYWFINAMDYYCRWDTDKGMDHAGYLCLYILEHNNIKEKRISAGLDAKSFIPILCSKLHEGSEIGNHKYIMHDVGICKYLITYNIQFLFLFMEHFNAKQLQCLLRACKNFYSQMLALYILLQIVCIPSLCRRLLDRDLINEVIFTAERADSIAVKYYAALVLIHMTFFSEKQWQEANLSKSKTLDYLLKLGWNFRRKFDDVTHLYKLVSQVYRYVKIGLNYRIQHWALHLIRKSIQNDSKVYRMHLDDPDGFKILKKLRSSPFCKAKNKGYCTRIINMFPRL